MDKSTRDILLRILDKALIDYKAHIPSTGAGFCYYFRTVSLLGLSIPTIMQFLRSESWFFIETRKYRSSAYWYSFGDRDSRIKHLESAIYYLKCQKYAK